MRHFIKRLKYKDDRYERGKTLLSKSSNVSHHKTQVERHKYEEYDTYPNSNPQSKSEKVNVSISDMKHIDTCNGIK